MSIPNRVVRLPPGRNYLIVPLANKAVARAGISMMTSCDKKALLAQSAVLFAIKIFGPKIVPGRRGTWQPPTTQQQWQDLMLVWRREIGPFSDLALYERPQASRDGLVATLVAEGAPLAVMKLRRNGRPELEHEAAVLAGLPREVSGVRVPRLLGRGNQAESEMAWMGMTPVSRGAHKPFRPQDLSELTRDISGALRAALPEAGTEIPRHWTPAHGDLTPWNLRADRAGPFLIDWEDASYAPPCLDEVYFQVVSAAVGLDSAPPWRSDQHEARVFLLNRIQARASTDEDAELNRALIDVLTH